MLVDEDRLDLHKEGLRRLDWSPVLRSDAAVLLLGFPQEALAGLVVFNVAYSAFVHANLNWTFGPFRCQQAWRTGRPCRKSAGHVQEIATTHAGVVFGEWVGHRVILETGGYSNSAQVQGRSSSTVYRAQ